MGTMRTRRSPSLLAVLVFVAVLGAAGCVPDRPAQSGGSVVADPTASATPEPTPAGPTPTPSFIRPTPTPLPTFLVYIVRPGDSLEGIADDFGTTGRSIAQWNRFSYPSLDPLSDDYEPDRIVVGWALRLIPGLEYDPEELPEPSG
jgi:hypothetical protein